VTTLQAIHAMKTVAAVSCVVIRAVIPHTLTVWSALLSLYRWMSVTATAMSAVVECLTLWAIKTVVVGMTAVESALTYAVRNTSLTDCWELLAPILRGIGVLCRGIELTASVVMWLTPTIVQVLRTVIYIILLVVRWVAHVGVILLK
jgi:hypothetical protein